MKFKKSLMIISFCLLIINQSFSQANPQRKVLLEISTASWCGPCYTLNKELIPWLTENAEKCVVVKYQQDSYCTDDVAIRANYYGIQYIPTSNIDGMDQYIGDDHNYVINAVNNAYQKSADAEITGSFHVNETKIFIEGRVVPFISGEDYRIHISINERKTTGNHGSNGEKEFYHVCMKMLPDGQGETVSLSEGVPISFNYEYDMASTYVEEMDDLEVAIFVQHSSTKEVLNAAYLENAKAPAPKNIVAEQKETGDLNINIHWEKPDFFREIDGYNIYRDNIKINDQLITATHYADLVQDYGVKYCYVVTASSNGVEGYPAKDCAITMVDIPQPINVQAKQKEFNSLEMYSSWEMPETYLPIAGYHVYCNGARITETPITETYIEHAGISFKEYCYEIEAVVGEIKGSRSEKSCITLDGVSIYNVDQNQPVIYPNPVTDKIYIDSASDIEECKVYDLQGKLIYSHKGVIQEISAGKWDKGGYILLLYSNSNVIKKIIIKN
ncbi:MAG: Omp28-related outer membrane protein [Bacteroidales bacterium]|jgi:thiol-disulfide isomerase/thioredoxin|nr:Omp28-related outer membrane protein [Bacteroidales bacterium]